tara:strand:- start:739 stop:924 length:186 start_codon:yes stop_codon:yes gene_type:complete
MLDRSGPLWELRIGVMAGEPWAAPFCAMMLADIGAEVVRVSRPNQKLLFGLEQKNNFYDCL